MICEEILAKKDYYEILGVEKTASEEDIKKQYKSLALKLHPDKNRSHKSTEAFKKVTQAFSCLLNKEKRKIYDEHGNEEGFRTRYKDYFKDEDEMDPEDIYEFFLYGRVNRDRRRRRGQQAEPEYGRWFMVAQFMPVIVMVILSTYMNFKAPSEPTFTLEPNRVHTFRRTTFNPEVEYYVMPTNDEKLLEYYNDPEFEKKVIESYRGKLTAECRVIRQKKFDLEANKKKASEQDEINRLEDEISSLNFASCELLKELE